MAATTWISTRNCGRARLDSTQNRAPLDSGSIQAFQTCRARTVSVMFGVSVTMIRRQADGHGAQAAEFKRQTGDSCTVRTTRPPAVSKACFAVSCTAVAGCTRLNAAGLVVARIGDGAVAAVFAYGEWCEYIMGSGVWVGHGVDSLP